MRSFTSVLLCAGVFVIFGCVSETIPDYRLTRGQKLSDAKPPEGGVSGDLPTPDDEGSDAPTPSATPPPPAPEPADDERTPPPAPEDPCEGLDYQGECQGDLARWCEDGELRTTDCSSRGGCEWIDDEIGYYCPYGSGGGSCPPSGGGEGGGSCPPSGGGEGGGSCPPSGGGGGGSCPGS